MNYRVIQTNSNFKDKKIFTYRSKMLKTAMFTLKLLLFKKHKFRVI